MRTLIAAAALVVAPALADAQPEPEPPPDPPAPDAAPAAPAPPTEAAAEPPPTPAELAERIDDLEAKQQELERGQRRAESTKEQVDTLVPLRRFITVFVDVGAFAVGGDGSGIRSDLGHIYFPQYRDRIAGQWVFMGDPLSTAINSLGEPADTSDSREVRTDNLASQGHPSLLVNALGLKIFKDVGHDVSIGALAELLPRPGRTIIDVELAHIDYRPTPDLVISAGKIDSVLGVEYRWQDAFDRVEVTPSLICRYTCGRPLGVEARLTRERMQLSAAVTDGDFFDERFEPAEVLKANALPTGAAHLQWTAPVGQGLTVGISGALGPQDKQPDAGIAQWHIGLDARLRDLDGFDVTAEYVQGQQDGWTTSTATCNAAPCLVYKGGYLLVDRRVNPRFIPYVRVDWRDAVHQNGTVFVYESHVARATVGAHFELTSRIIGKIEYTFNHELGGIPQFADDILTSSIVVATD